MVEYQYRVVKASITILRYCCTLRYIHPDLNTSWIVLITIISASSPVSVLTICIWVSYCYLFVMNQVISKNLSCSQDRIRTCTPKYFIDSASVPAYMRLNFSGEFPILHLTILKNHLSTPIVEYFHRVYYPCSGLHQYHRRLNPHAHLLVHPSKPKHLLDSVDTLLIRVSICL